MLSSPRGSGAFPVVIASMQGFSSHFCHISSAAFPISHALAFRSATELVGYLKDMKQKQNATDSNDNASRMFKELSTVGEAGFVRVQRMVRSCKA